MRLDHAGRADIVAELRSLRFIADRVVPAVVSELAA